tara:strand:+ start:3157 stop:4083 length:927 start_codon:yes stop_codon:yes gene_type:complete
MNKPKITVIIPCKNAESTIQKTFDSLREQKYENLECIVMDSLSKDNTCKIIEKNSDIISKFISEQDRSGADACNKAISMSSGEIIGFLYADDYLSNTTLNDISIAYQNNLNINIFSYGLSIEKLESKKIITQSFRKKNIQLNLNNILFKHVLNHFYNRKIFEKYGMYEPLYYDGTIFYSNDREFMIRLALNNEKNFVIEKVLYRMTTHENSHTGNRKNIKKIRYEHIGIADKYLSQINLSPYKKRKLIDFKSHNLSLLLVYYFYKMDLNNFLSILKQGYQLKKIYWILDIIICPLSEIIYRLSVKRWI